MLKVEHISSGYGKKQVLYDVSFEVNKGEVILLTGGNGSGKSTALKCIFGLLPLWSGYMSFENVSILGTEQHKLIQMGLVYTPQKNNYFENLSIEENLSLSGSCYSRKVVKERLDYVYNEFPFLKKNAKKTPFKLSGGEKQILVFASALMHMPHLILFDEPFSGIDQRYSLIIYEEFMRIKKQGVSVLIVEHHEVDNMLIDRKLKLYLGKIIKNQLI